MGVMSAKLFSAMVGGMNSNLSEFQDWKDIGKEFKDAFSNKELEGKDSSYPYSQDYFEKMKDDALRQLKEAGATAVDKLREVNLGGSSGSEAVRQARLNANDVDKKPNKVEIGNNNVKLNDD